MLTSSSLSAPLHCSCYLYCSQRKEQDSGQESGVGQFQNEFQCYQKRIHENEIGLDRFVPVLYQNWIRCSVVQNSAMRCSAMQCSTVQCEYCTVLYGTTLYWTVLHSTVPYCTA
jgi:hypothetical protein